MKKDNIHHGDPVNYFGQETQSCFELLIKVAVILGRVYEVVVFFSSVNVGGAQRHHVNEHAVLTFTNAV